MDLSPECLAKHCLICALPGRYLCQEHEKFYILDAHNGWLRFKKCLGRGARKHEDAKKYHKTEAKLHGILRSIFGRHDVIASVHPLWALSNKGVLLEYDIGIVSKKLLVEYEGLQHYEYPNFFHKTKAAFLLQKEHDSMKAKLALDHGWELIIVKYNEKVAYKPIYNRFRRYIGRS